MDYIENSRHMLYSRCKMHSFQRMVTLPLNLTCLPSYPTVLTKIFYRKPHCKQSKTLLPIPKTDVATSSTCVFPN